MSKLDERINKFLDLKYPNEPLWRNRQRSHSIKTYVLWNIEDNIRKNIKRNLLWNIEDK